MLLFIALWHAVRLRKPFIQIHLMLLFIGGFLFYISFYCRFKYISCYCLSILLLKTLCRYPSFKYISCYCLSQKAGLFRSSCRIQIHLMLLFIDIWQCAPFLHPYSNTSHVIVYRLKPCNPRKQNRYSNTSHVIVYLRTIS